MESKVHIACQWRYGSTAKMAPKRESQPKHSLICTNFQGRMSRGLYGMHSSAMHVILEGQLSKGLVKFPPCSTSACLGGPMNTHTAKSAWIVILSKFSCLTPLCLMLQQIKLFTVGIWEIQWVNCMCAHAMMQTIIMQTVRHHATETLLKQPSTFCSVRTMSCWPGLSWSALHVPLPPAMINDACCAACILVLHWAGPSYPCKPYLKPIS